MLRNILSSLSFHISAVFLLLLTAFGGTTWYTLSSLRQQQSQDAILQLASRLQLTVQQMATQAMNYQQNAPRDYPTYFRDVRLYYEDLKAHAAVFDEISEAFMRGDFGSEMTGMDRNMQPPLGQPVRDAIATMEAVWLQFRERLFDALGPDAAAPRLEYAAERLSAGYKPVQQAVQGLEGSLHAWATETQRILTRVNYGLVLFTAAGSVPLIVWLLVRVIVPLRRTVEGFERVALGNFEHHLEVSGASELRLLSSAFNDLSERLHLLFQLIERLEQGSDLDQVLCFLSRDFPDLLRIDWIGVLFVTGDGSTAQLEASYLDGQPERASKQLFRLQGTLLERAIAQATPMHVPDMVTTAQGHPEYQFLGALCARGMRDSIFLPLTAQSRNPIPAVVAFATRQANRYDDAHLDFLHNIAQLVTQSFSRTVRLSEHTRLAAIGKFASGIAHELRSPLATVGLALDAFKRIDLTEPGRKRLALAQQETQRMGRLLEEILLYAKPLQLHLQPMRLEESLSAFVTAYAALAEARRQRFVLEVEGTDAEILGDPERMTQVWINLARNACDAAPDATAITWSVTDDPGRGAVRVRLTNLGPNIPDEVLARMFEPFFSTKGNGTGLGLPIVKRLLDAHGGEVAVESGPELTAFTLTLPRFNPRDG